MEPAELLALLVELARESGLPIQRVSRQPVFEGLSPSSSGVCKVKGEVRVLLSDSDPVEERVRVLAMALRRERAEILAGRFLPPALRELLEGEPEP